MFHYGTVFGGQRRICHGIGQAEYHIDNRERLPDLSKGGKNMAEIKVIRLDEVEAQPLPGAQNEKAGLMKRIIYPPRVQSAGVFFAYAECNPGHSPHRWHNHLSDSAKGYKVEYPANFEEVYYILNGHGKMQWKTETGKIEEEPVGPGDTIFMPVGVAEHQLINDGDKEIVMVACGYPTPKVTLKE
jgi:mannose-6-phosphate isomerase-like protein (cupin superfamily)